MIISAIEPPAMPPGEGVRSVVVAPLRQRSAVGSWLVGSTDR